MEDNWKIENLTEIEFSNYGGMDISYAVSPQGREYIKLNKFRYIGKKKVMNFKEAIYIPLSKFEEFKAVVNQIQKGE